MDGCLEMNEHVIKGCHLIETVLFTLSFVSRPLSFTRG
jgi:hypothetical protein